MFQEYLTEKSERAEPQEESDWPLHLDAAELMLPLFYAPGHHNSARDGLYYLKSIQSLPENVRYQFLRGGHIVQNKPGAFSGIWTDMVIKMSYMKYGHSSSSCLDGQEMKPETMKTCA